MYPLWTHDGLGFTVCLLSATNVRFHNKTTTRRRSGISPYRAHGKLNYDCREGLGWWVFIEVEQCLAIWVNAIFFALQGTSSVPLQ